MSSVKELVDRVMGYDESAGPRGNLLTGSLAGLRADPLEVFTSCWRDYGDVIRLRAGGRLYARMFVHPDGVRAILQGNSDSYIRDPRFNMRLKPLLGDGLITTSGRTWRRHRTAITPALSASRVQGQLGELQTLIDGEFDGWLNGTTEGTVDLHAGMMKLTLRVGSHALFGADSGSFVSAFEDGGRYAVSYLNDSLFKLVPPMLSVKTPAVKRFWESKESLDRVVESILVNRDAVPDDFIGLLTSYQDEDGGLTDQEIRDELLTLLFAAHDTTANALTWSLYLLMTHRDALDTVRDAVRSGDPSADEQIDAVVREAMRLYPPAWGIPRIATEDNDVDGSLVRKGEIVIVSPYLTHRHEDFWDDPEAFMPERFIGTAAQGRHLYQYFPFGGGPRRCVGMAFAELEARLVLRTMLSRFDFSLVGGAYVRPQPVISLQPAGGLPARVRRAA